VNDAAVLIVAVLAIYGAVLGIAVSGRFFPVPDRKLRQIATHLGFTLDGNVLRGDWHGVPVTIEREGFETLGGYLSTVSGSIPEVGEKFAHNGFQFTVHTKEGPRIDRVRVTRSRSERDKTSKSDLSPIAPRPSPARSG
jgi:hypothetical protein